MINSWFRGWHHSASRLKSTPLTNDQYKISTSAHVSSHMGTHRMPPPQKLVALKKWTIERWHTQMMFRNADFKKHSCSRISRASPLADCTHISIVAANSSVGGVSCNPLLASSRNLALSASSHSTWQPWGTAHTQTNKWLHNGILMNAVHQSRDRHVTDIHGRALWCGNC